MERYGREGQWGWDRKNSRLSAKMYQYVHIQEVFHLQHGENSEKNKCPTISFPKYGQRYSATENRIRDKNIHV